MPPHEIRRLYKRPAISDQQRRREASLLRQSTHRSDAQNRARLLATSLLSCAPHAPLFPPEPSPEPSPEAEMKEDERQSGYSEGEFNAGVAARMRGAHVRRWFSKQIMLPEWMIDVPPSLDRDWYVIPRPAGKRCFVVSCNGRTISRLRNGSVLHQFPSSLPNGSRTDRSGPASSYSILDCIFHEPDQTYYVIDMVCWKGYSLYECNAEFRFFWLKTKLAETGACDPPSTYHKFRFNVVPVDMCDQLALHTAYTGTMPYVKDGLLFYNKHAHYETGNTPLALVWKDAYCSQYFLDTDGTGQVPSQQQVVLELQDDGKLVTSDDPHIIMGCSDAETIQKSSLKPGNLLRYCIRDENVKFANEKLEVAQLDFIGKSNQARAFADSYSKILFQYAARHSPVRFEDLMASIQPGDGSKIVDVDMTG